MKNLIYFISLIILSSCGVSKQLTSITKTENNVVDDPMRHSSESDRTKAVDSVTAEEISNENISLHMQRSAMAAPAAVVWPGPVPKYTIVVNVENRNVNEILGSSNAKYINDSIIKKGVAHTNWREMGDASQTNYVATQNGTRHGITSNNPIGFRSLPGISLNTVIKNDGGTVKSYIQGYPSIGYTGFEYGSEYRARHNFRYGPNDTDPLTLFPYENIPQDLTQLGTLTYLQLSETNNTHDSNVKTLDNFLKTDSSFQRIRRFARDRPDVLLVVWLDENNVDGDATGPVLVLFYGGMVKENLITTTQYNHYSFTKMMCNMHKVAGINSSDAAVVPTGWWKTTVVPPDTITPPGVCYKTIQKDTVVQTGTRDSTYTAHVTVPVFSHATITVTIQVPCDTIIPPVVTDTIWRGVYMNSIDKIVGDKAKEDAALAYLKSKKFTACFDYSIDNANSAALAKFNIRRRREAGITEIGATASSGSTFVGARKQFNLNNTDSARYNSWNLEFEPWNATDVTAAWNNNKQYLIQMNAGKESAFVDTVTDYFGWWTKAPMTTEAPGFLVANLDYGLLHDYRTTPDWSYLQKRFDDQEAKAIAQGVQYSIAVIFSAEPAFMQNWLKTHSLDEAFAIIAQGFRARHYTHLKLKGYLVFHLDFLRVAQPATAPGMRANSQNSFSDPHFKNITTPSHLKMAEMEDEQ